jgi:hypothetical protein
MSNKLLVGQLPRNKQTLHAKKYSLHFQIIVGDNNLEMEGVMSTEEASMTVTIQFTNCILCVPAIIKVNEGKSWGFSSNPYAALDKEKSSHAQKTSEKHNVLRSIIYLIW